MSTRIMILSLIIISSLGSHTALAQTSRSDLQPAFRQLEISCLRNKSENRTQKWSGSCFCLSNNLRKEMVGLPFETALKEIEWAKAVFDQTLTLQEFGQDPLNLVGTLDDILNRCEQLTGK